MKSEIIKYKHYLLLLVALITANFVLEPLWQYALDTQNKVQLMQKKAAKITNLLSVEDQVDEQVELMSSKRLKLQPYLFPASSESEFKLLAQGKIESILANANCNIDSIGWKSRSKIEKSLIRWTLEARYKGNAECALKAIRTIEEQTPVINIASYSLGGSEVSGSKRNSMVIQLNLVMWQNAHGVAL
ncbi:hypothetical protein NDQ71_10150 [Pseudoalteromonas sp. KG3]|uniref:hypothetical protein n=1 Tax=Pseudoalteromonas sp. KG3 TaxID=2951137 RepID=UPI00265849E0|nr:hypothetical protein [Pseudoalteromonas sp. KG3]WKD22050.1 hypothetical protein NDQ71_10150 [Pseudoalteromonas sp. KG3]